ncbi:MAG: HAD family hydrolase [Rhizobacter sp.]|nr:HAD family hydrolase [Chlorobiales bacterium]
MRNVKAIIFDLGGTLLHLDYPYFVTVFAERGFTVSEGEFFLAVARANQQLDAVVIRDNTSTDASRWQHFFEFLLSELRVPFDRASFITDVLRPRHATVNLWNYVLPETDILLESLAQKYPLAMISNSDGRAEAKTLQYGLREHLEFVIDSHFVGLEKPNPKIFEMACERLELAPSECVYVGDIYSVDVRGAIAAGLKPILIDCTATPRTDCLVLRSITDLRGVFLD